MKASPNSAISSIAVMSPAENVAKAQASEKLWSESEYRARMTRAQGLRTKIGISRHPFTSIGASTFFELSG